LKFERADADAYLIEYRIKNRSLSTITDYRNQNSKNEVQQKMLERTQEFEKKLD